ncbi:hypothetical protein M9H77_36258 [Catharanthus roseus]|uniref:Uncharacterized protein n=1 Tax=Catharanthus roseus TaxID=4058 RepID=A0ACB9ZRP3_CATRO|nr:hypothetical protein M9H77_36258 [Catharanthus roseus]
MDSIKLFSLLKSCTSSKSLTLGKLLHQKVVIFGLQNNLGICKNLINLYISCGKFNCAKQVFHIIENPLDITLWNGLMAAYTKNYMFDETLLLFDRLLNFPYLKPNDYTYPSVFKACSGLKRLGYGKMVHAHVIKIGVSSDVVVASSMVGLYAKCDMFGAAIKLFDEMPERDVASWNHVISCYYQSGQYLKALDSFEKMKELGFGPNSVTFTSAVSSCARLLDLERGQVIHKELEQSGLVFDGFVTSALVDMYGKCGRLEKAREIFKQIKTKNLVTWNAMISGYCLRGDTKTCIELLLQMNNENIKPRATTLSCLLMACSKSAQLRHGKFVHGYIIRNDIETDVLADSSLVDLYFKCGAVASAENVFAKMSKNHVCVWNSMISGYVSVGRYFEALAIFNEMRQMGIKPDAITITSALSSCTQLTALEQGKKIHNILIEIKLESDEIVMAALLDMYAKCGAINEALYVFNQLPERDIVSWTSMIAAYGSHGRAYEALELFHRMQQSNVRPDRVTFLAIVSACSHAGLVDEGHYYFNLMINSYKIKPSIEDYSCFVDLFGRSGRLREAYEILRKAPFIGNDVGLLSTLFSACLRHGEQEIGDEIAMKLMERDLDDPSVYISLEKMYGSVKKWDEARKLRMKMKEFGIKKNPGCSWIETDNRIQAFFAEYKSFPEAERVYMCLSTINNHMEKDEHL